MQTGANMNPPNDADNPAYCEDCANAIRRLDGRDLSAYRWLCMRFPREQRPNFVSRKLLIDEPYLRCATMNADGHCVEFQPLRGADHG
jgi:hypothetical protein